MRIRNYWTVLLVQLFLGFESRPLYAQKSLAELEVNIKNYANDDSVKVNMLNDLGKRMAFNNTQKAARLIDEALALAQKISYPRGEAYSLRNKAIIQQNYRNPEAWESLAQAIEIFERIGDKKGLLTTLSSMGWAYQNQGDYPKAIDFHYKALLIAENENSERDKIKIMSTIGYVFVQLGDYNKADKYLSPLYQKAVLLKDNELISNVCRTLGEYYTKTKQYQLAIVNFEKAKAIEQKLENKTGVATLDLNIANVLSRTNDCQKASQIAKTAIEKLTKLDQISEVIWGYAVLGRAAICANLPDSALTYGRLAYTRAQEINSKEFLREATEILFLANTQKNNTEAANLNQQELLNYDDSLSGQQTMQLVEATNVNYELENQKIQIQLLKKESELSNIEAKNQKILFFVTLAGLLGVLGFIFVLIKNNKTQKKNNLLLQEQKAEIELQKTQLEQTLTTLQSTQKQLIQSEKLASLGELTAGIAHEIQNPLNFVTNFSELSVELIEEAPKPPKGASKDWTPTDSPIGGWELFFTDIRQNLEKINHHGKRASSIVKAMLEHSRASTGMKEPTDINKLADEYLRLSYHGLRAKDSNESTTRFNADFELIADPNLPLINVIQQDIGRVLLNLINNAFQAVLQNNVETLPATSLPKYQPIVVVSTQKIDNQIVIKISDNGSGMSEAIKAKIFQPFFTTKSAGEGTGLGLSLAYDIITKGHGGTIEVESEVGKGATFTVMLPIEPKNL
jgi:two-component system, NtrC family, sensor kinase